MPVRPSWAEVSSCPLVGWNGFGSSFFFWTLFSHFLLRRRETSFFHCVSALRTPTSPLSWFRCQLQGRGWTQRRATGRGGQQAHLVAC